MCSTRRVSPIWRRSGSSWPRSERPVNVLALPSAPTVGELVGAGVSRVSVGGAFAFAFAALGAVVEAARELQECGTYTFWEHARPGSRSAKAAFTTAASSNP
jgi:2-methylisocitrate lyase-like PEP mutase family enzyme